MVCTITLVSKFCFLFSIFEDLFLKIIRVFSVNYVDLNEIVELVGNWESKGGSLSALAENLVRSARTLSLDDSRDSPFALLAKENDIMWGGGMPDDTTVVVVKVT